MLHRFVAIACCALCITMAMGQEVVHPALASEVRSSGGLSLTLAGRWQNWNYSEAATLEKSINSPKSVNISPDGKKVYVNSLEGATTVVFDAETHKKIAEIKHVFDGTESDLWSAPSGFYPFRHYADRPNVNAFTGRPVESAFSHAGRYLWVPYYRRSYDLNAQDPSAVAIIDTRTDKIVRLMEAGVLPKMIAVSPDSRHVAIAHWGDNTIGYIDCSSDNPYDWHHLKPFVVDHQIKWNLSLTDKVDRDNGSGNALRGTAFTPDGKFLLVGCMGGNGGIAVVDVVKGEYLGKLYGMLPNVRHLLFSNGNLYLSVNKSGHVQRLSGAALADAISSLRASGKKSYTVSEGWQSAKVGTGARTIAASPKGRFIFAACNFNSTVDVVDTKTMRRVASLSVDSFPVGMDISADGRTLYVTAQGRKDKVPSGNCVDIITIDY